MSVHLVSTYPVFWSRFAVLRDFLQNFYDAVGSKRFDKRVHFQAEEDELEVSTGGEGFELDWLTHIGASTKTQAAAGAHAGYFGEGFKIAALCAVRDFGWSVQMGSQNWSASVVLNDEHIGDTPVRVLAYRVHDSNPSPGTTWLRLGGLSGGDQRLARDVRLCFDFAGNPIVGEELCSSASVTVSRATDRRLSSGVPFVGRTSEPGTFFLAHQARATLPFPLVISLRDVRTPERDRPALYDFQVVDYLAQAARNVSAETAVEFLGFLRTHWRSPLPASHKCGSWARVVTALIRRVETSSDAVEVFRARWPDLYVRHAIRRGMMGARNRRSAAMAWLRVYKGRSDLVQAEFARLGYPSVEEACEAADGFPSAAPHNPVHDARIEALRTFVSTSFAPLLSQAEEPAIEVLDLRGCGWGGVATVLPCRDVRYSMTGRRMRRTVKTISLSAEALDAPSPASALATFIHERCHAFGGDESAGFSAALTDALQLLAEKGASLEALNAAWTAAGT